MKRLMAILEREDVKKEMFRINMEIRELRGQIKMVRATTGSYGARSLQELEILLNRKIVELHKT